MVLVPNKGSQGPKVVRKPVEAMAQNMIPVSIPVHPLHVNYCTKLLYCTVQYCTKMIPCNSVV